MDNGGTSQFKDRLTHSSKEAPLISHSVAADADLAVFYEPKKGEVDRYSNGSFLYAQGF